MAYAMIVTTMMVPAGTLMFSVRALIPFLPDTESRAQGRPQQKCGKRKNN